MSGSTSMIRSRVKFPAFRDDVSPGVHGIREASSRMSQDMSGGFP